MTDPHTKAQVPSPLLVHHQHGVLTLTLNRPQARNALNAELIAALIAQLQQVPRDVRTVVLCGAGSSFCSGADLSWMGQPQASAGGPDQAEQLQKLFALIAVAPQVVVAIAQGPVRGGGVGLLCAADLVLAGASLTLAFPEASLGLVPAVIAPYVVERMGMARARALFLTSEVVPASDAQRLGVVHEIVDDNDLQQSLAQLLSRLHHNGPQALATTKELLRAMPQNHGQALSTLCLKTLQKVRQHDEAIEGCQAFLQRRRPAWRLP